MIAKYYLVTAMSSVRKATAALQTESPALSKAIGRDLAKCFRDLTKIKNIVEKDEKISLL